MHSASDEVRAAIVAADGAIRFDEFMRLALYGRHGFYTTGGQAGRRGDFITSPEVGPLFGAVVARWIDAGVATPRRARRLHHRRVRCRPRHSRPRRARGSAPVARPLRGGRGVGTATTPAPGRGAVRRIVATGSGGRGCGDRQRTARQPSVSTRSVRRWLAGGDGVGRPGLRVRREHRRARSGVGLAAAAGDARGACADSGSGSRLGSAARGKCFVKEQSWPSITSRRARPSSVVGRGATGCAPSAPMAAVLTISVIPGSQDITAQVCIDQLPSPQVVGSQRDFLRRWGIDELVEEGRRAWAAAAARSRRGGHDDAQPYTRGGGVAGTRWTRWFRRRVLAGRGVTKPRNVRF